MLSIAREINFSETVFLFPPKSKEAEAGMRIFTPAREIPFAGHPVIGAAYVVIKHLKGKKPSEIELELKSRMVKVEIEKKGKSYNFAMHQPSPRYGSALQNRGQIAKAVGIKKYEITGGGVVSNGMYFLMVEAEDEEVVKRARLNAEQASMVISRHGVSGIYLFARVEGKRKKNIHSRFFAPTLSVMEDPATGSAAGALGGYLARILKFPKTLQLKIEQGVEMGRPSLIRVYVDCDAGRVRKVRVSGSVVSAGEGYILIP